MTSERRKLQYIWYDMKARCQNIKHKAYKNYGGRGVTVCDEWKISSEKFISDMGLRPIGGLLERRENNKGYSPDNCYWASRKEQNSNRRICIYVMDEEERITLKEFCRRKNITYRPFHKRLARGWTFERALSLPIGFRKITK